MAVLYRESARQEGTMSSTVTETATQTGTLSASNALKLDGTTTKFGDWHDDPSKDGYAIIEGAIQKSQHSSILMPFISIWKTCVS
jgi:hypothetical protein